MEKPGSGLSRRAFLGTAGAGLGVAAGVLPETAGAAARTRQVPASEKVVLGLIGCGGMGAANMRTLMEKPGVEVAALCDVDENRIPNDAAYVEKKSGRKPEIY